MITSQLALGDRGDPTKHGRYIDAFLCCAAEVPLPQNKPRHHLQLREGFPLNSEDLDAAFHFLDEQLQAKRLVLVYCGQGTCRSASVLAGYLALRSGEEPEDVLSRIRRLRPEMTRSGGTFRSIERYVAQKRSSSTKSK